MKTTELHSKSTQYFAIDPDQMFVPELFILELPSGSKIVARVQSFLAPLELGQVGLTALSGAEIETGREWLEGVAQYLAGKWGVETSSLSVRDTGLHAAKTPNQRP